VNGPFYGQCLFDSKEIDENDLQNEKHNEGTISGGQFWCLDSVTWLPSRHGHLILFVIGSDHCILPISGPPKNVPRAFQDIG
jgi:hypothetical protein